MSIVLQKVLNNPLLVAATFLAIYLVITFAFFDASFLVFAILYTILAYVTAVLTRWICRLIRMLENQNNNCNDRTTTRPITINTSPYSNVSVASDATLIPANNPSRINGNCNCRCNRR